MSGQNDNTDRGRRQFLGGLAALGGAAVTTAFGASEQVFIDPTRVQGKGPSARGGRSSFETPSASPP